MSRLKQCSVLLLLSLLLAAGSDGALARQMQPAVVRLGLLGSADSPAGRGAQLAIAEINGAGGITGPDGTVYAIELLSTPVRTADEVRAGLDALNQRGVLAILGPDDDSVVLATFNALRSARLPVFTAATGDALTIADTADFIFRARAPERAYAQAAAEYLAAAQPQAVIVPVQAGSVGPATEGLAVFTAALTSRGITPSAPVRIDADLSVGLNALLRLSPSVVAVWGEPGIAAGLLQALRDAAWPGLFFYRDASDPGFRAALTPGIAGGVLGVTNWTPGVRSAVSDRFLRTYVVTFASVPDGLSAAYYDAVYLIAGAVGQAGGSPQAVQRALRRLEGRNGVQGPLEPAATGTGETTTAAVVVELNLYAAPQVQAAFVDGEMLTSAGEGQGVAIQPTATASPLPPPTATLPPAFPSTPIPTSTPEGVYGIVNTFRLSVRTGPGLNYDTIGQLQAGDVIYPVGANGDFTWLVIPFRGTTGWVATYLVEMHGILNTLPIITPPASPTPIPTATPTPTPIPLFADLVIISAALDPIRPAVGQPFNVRALVRNDGNITSGETALAATFMPGDVYVSALIPALVPGQAAEVILRPTLNATGTYTVQLVADLNNMVNEGPLGEGNNLFPVTYTVDHLIQITASVALSPIQEHDIDAAGINDLRWDGTTLSAINGALLAVLPGVNWNTLHYDQLTGIGGLSVVSPLPGTVIGLITASGGRRGALRIDANNGVTINYTYRIYTP